MFGCQIDERLVTFRAQIPFTRQMPFKIVAADVRRLLKPLRNEPRYLGCHI